MDDQHTEKLLDMIKSAEMLAKALHVDHMPPETQFRIVGEWSGVLLKRLLLRVPAEHIEEVKQEVASIKERGGDIEEFVVVLKRLTPNFDEVFEEEVARAIEEFMVR